MRYTQWLMQIHLLKSKIHRATVTGGNVKYEGSLTIAVDLMEKVGLQPIRKNPLRQHGQRRTV